MSHPDRAKLLRLDLPPDVWARLDAEAQASGMKIGAYVRALIVARDKRKGATP